MSITQEEAARLWNTYQKSPLWAGWPEFQHEMAEKLTRQDVSAGETVFSADDAADYLYLIGNGQLTQTRRHDGKSWLERELSRGDMFGQQALFWGRQGTTVTARTPATLYRLGAADLRMALERNPEARESLLHEGWTSRLRSIPLFAALEDLEIRWLAQIMEEVTLPQNTQVGVDDKQGIWIIDWGQVEVSGPAAGRQTVRRLTAGNFFLSPGVRVGDACVADAATARLTSHLFFLRADHLYRLLSAFNIDDLIREPLNIAALLARTTLADRPGITEEHLRHLAGFCAWGFVPNGQNITLQGSVGYSFMVLNRGAAVVSAVDDQGRLRPRNLLRPGDAFGLTSVLESKARDATVRAVPAPGKENSGPAGAELVILDRRDLQYAYKERPDLWHRGVWIYDRMLEVEQDQPHYDWLEEGETVVWHDRPHILWFLVPQALLLGAFVVLTAIVTGLLGDSVAGLPIAFLIIAGVLYFPLAIWFAINYQNDYYVVTNRRVTRRDRELLVWEARTDAPLEMVQDVTIDANLIGRILNFGDVSVRTAARVGVIRFDNVPYPEDVKGYILRERAEAAAALRGHSKEMLRRGLMQDLRLSLPVPDLDRMRALGENVRYTERPKLWQRIWRAVVPPKRASTPVLPGTRRGKPAWLVRLVQPLPPRLRHILIGPPPPAQRPLSGPVLWHKHWIDFLRRAGLPLLSVLLLLALVFVVAVSPGALPGVQNASILLVLLPLLLAAGGWLWWQTADYWNDIYVVTDDRIIDVEKRPLGLSVKRREGTLDRVQTVYAEQRGFWANFLDYGDVIIRTAAAGEGFTFHTVGAPRLVQKVVFQKLDTFRRKQDERRTSERRQAIVEGLQVYHELREDRGVGQG